MGLSGLSSFIYNNSSGTFNVSGIYSATSGNSAGVLTLAPTNKITAASVGLGTTANNGGVDSGTVYLGTANTINAGTIVMGTNLRKE